MTHGNKILIQLELMIKNGGHQLIFKSIHIKKTSKKFLREKKYNQKKLKEKYRKVKKVTTSIIKNENLGFKKNNYLS